MGSKTIAGRGIVKGMSYRPRDGEVQLSESQSKNEI